MLPVITLIEMIGFADVAALLVTGIHCIELGSQRLLSDDKQVQNWTIAGFIAVCRSRLQMTKALVC